MSTKDTSRLIAGLSGMALLAVVTLQTIPWYSLPGPSVLAVLLILVVFLGSTGAVVLASRTNAVQYRRFTEEN